MTRVSFKCFTLQWPAHNLGMQARFLLTTSNLYIFSKRVCFFVCELLVGREALPGVSKALESRPLGNGGTPMGHVY